MTSIIRTPVEARIHFGRGIQSTSHRSRAIMSTIVTRKNTFTFPSLKQSVYGTRLVQKTLNRSKINRTCYHSTRAAEGGTPDLNNGAGGTKKDAEEKVGWWKKFAKVDRSQLAALGTAVLLSYGFISNVSYITSLLIAVYTTMATTGASPLVNAEAFKTFVGVYAGLWMIQNFLRPARIAFSVAFGPLFDKLVVKTQNRLQLKKKAYAFGILVFVINFCGTLLLMFGGLAGISLVTGVPLGWGEFGSFMKAAKGAKDALVAQQTAA
mmetsp:Transcript_26632/g.32334  ORF Transcript_26632/g.32334 Transcript_26632/m.32334 type:complete len:266 (+) Transcript_26632:186-983(+)|eukprot:CAMPEP_0197844808 /NCGR_PEP_ID=MMETSP1438-20131217/1788_1 /TAXON_ID=1461541 /ORGANISM="Pterosperma sp., Strain CCMP1384" /LENGTH=265 /DNA_ID=CAMNT_0043455789 /DNA_START=166 /DNA_END=963 /DNA_ORIENTATION=+